MSQFNQIDHIGIAVRDLDEAISFYETTFGMRCVHQEVNHEQGVREAMLQVGNGATRIQLLAPLDETSTIARFIERNGPGLQQIAYAVDSIEDAAAALESRGVSLIYPRARAGTAGSHVNFIHPREAGGVLVELVEPASE